MADKKTFTDQEKQGILARAEEIGVHQAAKEAGAAWQAVARWKKAAAQAVSITVEKAEAEAKKAEADVKAEAEKVEEKAKKTSARAKKTADQAKAAVKENAKKAEKTVKDTAKKAKSAAEKVADEVKAVEKKTEKAIKTASRSKKMIASLTIQSPLGGEITPDEIRAKVGEVDHIYVRVDQNKAYWVKGEETGSVDLW